MKQTVRQAARFRQPLDGVDTQALEGALQQVERELQALREAVAMTINEYCACGGCGPNDPEACFAFLIYHDINKLTEGQEPSSSENCAASEARKVGEANSATNGSTALDCPLCGGKGLVDWAMFCPDCDGSGKEPKE